jgi:hypothetical protein
LNWKETQHGNRNKHPQIIYYIAEPLAVIAFLQVKKTERLEKDRRSWTKNRRGDCEADTHRVCQSRRLKYCRFQCTWLSKRCPDAAMLRS